MVLKISLPSQLSTTIKLKYMTSQNRRNFIKSSGIAALGLTVFPSSLKAFAPSDKLRIAHIGLGGMGNSHMNWFAGIPEVDRVALCDVDENHLSETKNKLKELRPDGPKIKTYEDFRRILDRKDIDKAFKELKKEEAIVSPVRCKWEPAAK